MSGAVVIVGAGVVGLTTALQLILDGVSPSQITIVAKDGPEKSTSFVAGALWECGMHIVPNITVSQHPLKTNTAAKAMTPTTYRESSDLTSPAMTSWLQTHGTAELGSFRHLQHYDAVVADMGVYLGWLKDQLASHRVHINALHVTDLRALATPGTIVVNCTGLFNEDPAIFPCKGQVVMVHAPWIRSAICDEDSGAYMIPRPNGNLICGGTAENDVWNTDVQADVTDKILAKCALVVPSVARAKVVAARAGRMKLPVVSFLMAIAAIFVHMPTVVESNLAGVDFGGEFFKIALVKPGKSFEIVTNVHSKRKTETIVSFNGEERLFGADAMNIEVRRPQNAYSQIRRLLGTTVTHPLVESMTKSEYFPYTLTHNDTRGSVGLKHDDEHTFHAEELVAMVFTHAKTITNEFAEGPVRDWVVTVPSYFAEAQRQAVIDAAEIAGIRVLSLIDENTAAALHHALSIDVPEVGKPTRVMFYNMGSTSLQVSVVEYTSRIVPDGFKKNKTIVDFEVLGKSWDESLGGSQFDLRLADKFADEFNTKLKKGDDIRLVPRAMAKLRAAARKTKIVLSANEVIPVVVPSLHADLDFKSNAKRSEFEALCADLFGRVLGPVESVLQKTGLAKTDLSAIEIIGGGVRIPKIQSLLKGYFERDLGLHLNGDEAMALGAAFHGANLSTAFRVRHVGMTDIASYPVGVRLVDLHREHPAADDGDDKHWVKRASLFGDAQRLNVKKSVAFSHSTDVSCTFRYDQPSGLPAGTSALISRYNITGIDAFVSKYADKNLGEPKVTLTFSLDGSGLAHIVKAEATLEEEVEVVEKKKIKKDGDDKKKTTNDVEADKTEAKAEDDDVNDVEDKVEYEEIKTLQKKVHRGPLVVVRADGVHRHDAGMSIVPMSVRTKKESIALLSELDKADSIRKTNAEAKNRLEAFVYEAREYLSQQEEAVASVSTPDQREKLATEVDATEEWLYEDGDDLDANAYNERHAPLRAQLDALAFRVDELAALPEAILKAQQYVISTKDLMEQWATEKPQVTEAERGDIVAKVDELAAWIEEEQAKQAAIPKHDTPVLTSAQVLKKVSFVKKLVTALGKKPKPVVEKKKEEPEKKPKNDTADETPPEDLDGHDSKKDVEDKTPKEGDASTSDDKKKDEL
ncbi:hypothetical protein DYB26_000928 [Aphanomyces astaci]|uniref:FAD dependent oxidoreductase domain-containing protein n=2 Tax=Aphanomyces astaci TaxID=112090 RepID=A0A3R7C0Z7_APHAT|nr:hypothetical protein DYB26_000928 [Aphanomyces astaci]